MIILLKATNLIKTFGRLVAVSNVDIHVGQGEIVGLVGPNGAGKTTIVKTIMGLLKPTSGTLEFNGNPIHHVLEASNRGYVLETGRITLEGTSSELLDNNHVNEAYPGM